MDEINKITLVLVLVPKKTEWPQRILRWLGIQRISFQAHKPDIGIALKKHQKRKIEWAFNRNCLAGETNT